MKAVSTSAELSEKLTSLKLKRREYEQSIASELAGLYRVSKDPAPYIKQTLNDLAADTEVKKDLLKVGLHFASDYLVEHYVYRKADTFLSGLVSSLKNANSGKSELLDLVLSFISKKR